MNVLVLGSGGREHALAWKISQSPLLHRLYCGPGNPGTAAFSENLPVDPCCFESVKRAVLERDISMVVVGPEEPLVRGIADFFASEASLRSCFLVGPGAVGAQLEGSKDFAKAFMQRHAIPTAGYASFTTEQTEEAVAYLSKVKAPYVLKADGLAAGKGVVIVSDIREAEQEVRAILGGKFGKAGHRIVIEEFLEGIELSVFFITDGKSYKILPHAKDYKRVGNGDTGPNTGGMGAVSPVPFADEVFMKKVEDRIIAATVRGLACEQIDYKGFVFAGLMNCGGEPYVIEYNVRMGDPETEVVMPRLQSDLLALLLALAEGRLASASVEVSQEGAVGVMLVSGGYPQDYAKGHPVLGLDKVQDALVFHAGTREQEGVVLSWGGRVLAVTGIDADLSEARNKAYKALDAVGFKDAYYRTDIGLDIM
ncbi:MAG: phosphoribosylamine--glycine ligase [Bacteroidales bacterium]|nr:phosphoribosylamine--glycine ligase [Bacteroidales bacterium]